MKKIVVPTAFLALTTMILVASPNAVATSKSALSNPVAHYVGTSIDNSKSLFAGPGSLVPPPGTIKLAPQVNVAGPGSLVPPPGTIKLASKGVSA